MKRLVYSPKAFVYVMNSTPPPGPTPSRGGPYLHNLSDLVVSGSVTRKLDQVSSAEVTFRNPDRIYTKPGNPIFRPMDAITIFLQRLPGAPIQTFTGYLDKTPYYQMYPGTATLSASCTLKRLQYTYFDPGLPFTQQFMAKYGWKQDGQGGIQKAGQSGMDAFVDQAQDSNISELLFVIMEHIGQWRSESIWIEKLPERLMDRLVNLYNAISDENKEASKEFETFLKDYVGTGSYTPDASGGGSSGSGSAAGGPPAFRQAANKWGNKLGVDPAVLMGIAEIESGFGANQGPSTAGAKGNMQFMPATRDMILSKYGVDAFKNVDEAVAAAAYYLRDSGAKQDIRKAIFAYNHADWYVNEVLAAAEKYRGDAKKQDSKTPTAHSSSTPQNEADKANKDQSSANPDQTKPGGNKKSTPKTTKIFAPISGDITIGRGWHEVSKGVVGITTTSGHPHWHSGVDVGVAHGSPCVAPADGEIVLAQETGFSGGGMIHFKFTEDTGDIKAGTIIGWGHISKMVKNSGSVKAGEIIALSGTANNFPHVHFIQRSDNSGLDGSTDPVPLFKALMKGETTPTSGGTDAAAAPGNSGQDALQAAKAVGLLTAFQFPAAVDQAESLLLKGDKSLMNDQPLLPFIEELARGSMRQFQSMPNGDFYSFHPDYFNSFGTSPYWEIDDIEVIDGSIELTDDNLATHVYVVGATRTGDQSIDISRRLTTAGVVNVFNAGTADFLNIDTPPEQANDNSKNKDKSKPFLGDVATTTQFMERYGARPFVSNNPFIRSHIFETFYAFQTFMLMWSRQFLTPFTFTFMPELYPGGHVSFPTHGIQCFIEEVHHQWDYTSGFLTSANLTAPSALDKSHNVSRGMVMGGVTGGSKGGAAPAPPGKYGPT